MGFVHVSCLEEWLKGSSRDSCELCSAAFKTVRTPKYSCCQSIWIYFTSKVGIRRLARDMILLCVSMVNALILLYLWIIIILMDIVNIFGLRYPNYESLLMVSHPIRSLVYFIFFTVCLTFVTFNTIDDCYRICYWNIFCWYNWWQTTVDVKLVLNADEEHLRNQ